MKIAASLGLETEKFCRMSLKTKMLLSNIIGHAAELQYEKKIKDLGLNLTKAGTDEHFDYEIDGSRNQVKRFETSSTNFKKIGVNLTQTHGDRSAQDAFYRLDSFDKLILFDVGLDDYFDFRTEELPVHPKYPTHIKGRFSFERDLSSSNEFNKDFLATMKIKNKEFPEALEDLRKKYELNYLETLKKICNLTENEIDSLFSEENFRLITGAKGFSAEEHFNVFLEKNHIDYIQDTDMYSKVDHWLQDLRVQVKTPYQSGVTETHWAFKTHKSHGAGEGELYSKNAFDVVALFIGFEIDKNQSKYLPISVRNSFIFIPMEDIEEHPKHPGFLKRVTRVSKDRYGENDVSYLEVGN